MLLSHTSSKKILRSELRTFLLVALIFASDLAHAQGVAKVVSLSGKVIMNTKAEQGIVLKTNSDVPTGAVVKTGAGAVVKLLFTDDTIMDLGPDTSFRVDEFKDSGGGERTGVFSLAYGTLRSLVAKPVTKGDYKVKTKDAIMGVRGTEFVVSSPFVGAGTTPPSSLATNVVVASGTVSVAASSASAGGGAGFTAPSMNVVAGQSFSAAQLPTAGTTTETAAAPSQPQKVEAAQMTSIMGAARVGDSTFTKAITVGGSDTTADSSSSGGSGSEGAEGSKGGTSNGSSAGGGPSGGSMIMGNVMGAVSANIAQGGAAMPPHMGTMNFAPTGISINDVISAPPILQLPGQLRNITIIIQ